MNPEQRIRELELSNQELGRQLIQSERLRSLGALSGGIAHHFNNLLSVILGYSSYILNNEELSGEASDAMQKISEAAQRSRRLTDEILAFAGSEDSAVRSYHVHDTLTSVLSLLELHTTGQIQVATELEARQDQISAPQSTLHQVVFNLLTNAIDSMPAGGRLTVRTTNVAMPDEQGTDQPFLRIEVQDTSQFVSGAEDEEASQIKDRMGIKLSSVYGIVSKLEGTMLISAAPGDSTRVEVLLPVHAESASATAPAERPGGRTAPSRIWVVDDNMTFREMCRVVLRGEEHVIDLLECGEEMQARWYSSKPRPDLLIIDFSMPDYNGLELVEWLNDQAADVPVILVSGLSREQPDIRDALTFKRVRFLQKPFASSELSDAVSMALGETLIDSPN